MRFPINFYSRKHIEQLQLSKIKKIVEYAYSKSMFYRNLYNAYGFHPSQLKTYSDIQKIPIVRRKDLRCAPIAEIVTTQDLNKCHLHTTSGSSGLSVRYYFTKLEQIKKNYYVLRAYLMAGLPWFAVTVALRDPIDIVKPNILQKFGLFRYDYYNIYEPIEDIYNKLILKYKKHIDILKGYPSDLVNLATLVKNKNYSFPTVGIIYSDSEVLDSTSRTYIESVFHCKVLDFYASVECGMIAFQTPKSNLYCINEDAVLLETIKQDGLDEVVITNLRNKTFPIIRYEIGDAIDFGEQDIDEYFKLKTLKQIYGKYLDFLLMPDGTIVSPHIPKQDLTHQKGVAKFKLVQNDIDNIEIFIQKNDEFTESTELELVEKLNKGFNNQVNIAFKYVDKLDRGDKRKFKCIESKVAQNFLSRK